MEIAFNSQEFFCESHNVLLSGDQIAAHLNQNRNHKIFKIKKPALSQEEFEKTILSKIEEIIRVKLKVFQSSVSLNQIISSNTGVALKRLDDLTRIYKRIIYDSNENKNLQQTEIINSFNFKGSLPSQVVEHFSQILVKEVLRKDAIKKRIKTQVKKLFESYSTRIKTMIASPNSNFILTGGFEGTIRVWDTKSKLQAFVLQKHNGTINSLALGSDNQKLLSGSSDFSICLWNLDTKNCIKKFLGHKNKVFSVQVGLNNTKGFSGSYDKSIKIWNLVSLNLETTITLNSNIYCIRLIECDKVLIAGDKESNLTFLTLVNKNTIQMLTNNPYKLMCMCLTKDETSVIIGFRNGVIQAWMTRSRIKKNEVQKHKGSVNQIVVSHNSDYFVSCSDDKTVLIWESINFHVLKKLSYKMNVSGVSILEMSNFLVICQSDAKLFYFNLRTYEIEKKSDLMCLNTNAIQISNHFKYIAYGNQSVNLIDLENPKKVFKTLPFISMILCLKFSSNNDFLACGLDKGRVYILDVPGLVQLNYYELENIRVCRMTISENKKHFGFSNLSSKIIIWHIKRNEVVYSEQGIKVTDLAFCLNDKRLVYSVNKKIFVLDKEFKKVGVFDLFDIFSLTVSEDQNFIIGSNEKSFWFIISIKNCVILYKKVRVDKIENWSTRHNDLKCLLNARLPRISF